MKPFPPGTPVRHICKGYVGVVLPDITRMRSLFELPTDTYGLRVGITTDGRPRVASPSRLVVVPAEELIERRHREHLATRGLRLVGRGQCRDPIRTRSQYRASCWSCHHPVDSSKHWYCTSCRWLICDCGSCGCAYRRFMRRAS